MFSWLPHIGAKVSLKESFTVKSLGSWGAMKESIGIHGISATQKNHIGIFLKHKELMQNIISFLLDSFIKS
jgi:hypothetical protein